MKHSARSLAVTSVALALAGSTAVAFAAPSQAVAPATKKAITVPTWATSGSAYGSLVEVGSTVNSGRSAVSLATCGADSSNDNNATTDVELGTLGSVGVVHTNTTTTTPSKNSISTTSQASTGDVSLLGGLITASAVNSTATVSHNSTTTTGGSGQLVGLKVAGLNVPLSPRPNTTLTIPAVGRLTLNGQTLTTVDGVTRMTTNALVLTLAKASPLASRLGTTVVIGHSTAALMKMPDAQLTGAAFGSRISVGSLVTSGATFEQTMPCQGTGGDTRSSSGAGINVLGVLNTGTFTTSVTGTGGTSPTSATTEHIADINLLGGAVTVTAINAAATATLHDGKTTLSSDGTKLVGLKIGGKTLNIPIKENTHVNLAGLGTLWLDKVVTTKRSIVVHDIELVLGDRNSAGLKQGTVIDLGNARAGVVPMAAG